MHDMTLINIAFLSDDNAILTFHCLLCDAIIEIDTQEETVIATAGGDTQVKHRGESQLNLSIEFEEMTGGSDRDTINDLLKDVHFN
jgi:hypothetical protein